MDVLVVGGGMAGVSVAYELASTCRVTLLEAEGEMPLHATGRSAAFYLPAYGNAVVRALTADSRAAFDAFPELLGTPQLLHRRDVLYVADRDATQALAALAAEVGTVQPVDIETALIAFPSLRPEGIAAAALDASGSDIDVLALYQGYVRGLRERGGEVLRQARVGAISKAGSTWRVVTTDGRSHEAVHLVDAAGAWADEVAVLAGVAPVGLAPLRRSVFVSPVDAPPGFLGWPMLIDALERFYAKPEGDALLCSPAEEVPTPPGSPRADELLVAEAMERLRALTAFPLRSVRTSWAGLRTFAPDRTPVAGESSPGSGFWWLAGQGGYGIQLAPALAVDLAAQVLGEPSRYGASLSPARFA